MECVSKFFDELTTTELYEILKARAEIFVVEQNCIYQDMDDRDYASLHVYCVDNVNSINKNRVTAYLRIFPKPDEPGVVQMGRVLTLKHGEGLGAILLSEGIKLCKEKLGATSIYLEAQCYATGYYEREGFRICSEEFLEDGIPHVAMRLTF